MLFKVLAIPFYAMSTFGHAMMSIVLLIAPPVIIIYLLMLAVFGVLTYLTILASSAHSIVLLSRLRREGLISRAQQILHTIGQLVPVVDVIDQIMLVRLMNRFQAE